MLFRYRIPTLLVNGRVSQIHCRVIFLALLGGWAPCSVGGSICTCRYQVMLPITAQANSIPRQRYSLCRCHREGRLSLCIHGWRPQSEH